MLVPRWYNNLSRIVQPECVLYEHNLIGPFFILIDYYPVLLSISLFSLGLYQKELYLVLVGLALKWDLLLNIFLRDVVIPTATRFAGCGNESETFSFSFEHIVVFVTLMILYITLQRASSRMSIVKILLIYIFTVLVMVARVYVGINTVREMYAGAAVGMLNSFGIILVNSYIIRNHAKSIIKWRVVKFMGIKHTLFGGGDEE